MKSIAQISLITFLTIVCSSCVSTYNSKYTKDYATSSPEYSVGQEVKEVVVGSVGIPLLGALSFARLMSGTSAWTSKPELGPTLDATPFVFCDLLTMLNPVTNLGKAQRDDLVNQRTAATTESYSRVQLHDTTQKQQDVNYTIPEIMAGLKSEKDSDVPKNFQQSHVSTSTPQTAAEKLQNIWLENSTKSLTALRQALKNSASNETLKKLVTRVLVSQNKVSKLPEAGAASKQLTLFAPDKNDYQNIRQFAEDIIRVIDTP